jgi:hypothetical protein
MLQPTVTQRVRAFLAAEGARLEPWTSLDETYARLYSLLAARRDDPGFWAPLERLLGEVAAEAAGLFGPSGATPVAELLGRAEIERLTADLRRALPDGREPAGAKSLADFTAALGAPVLCAFLLLGLAASAGCSDRQEAGAALPPTPVASAAAAPLAIESAPLPEAAPPAAPAPPETAWFDGCSLPHKGVLWRSIDRAALGDDDKRSLCACFSELDGRWTNRLSFLFRNGKPVEIAKALEEMVACCAAEDKKEDAACADVAQTHAAVQQRNAIGVGFGAALYKGVCFD